MKLWHVYGTTFKVTFTGNYTSPHLSHLCMEAFLEVILHLPNITHWTFHHQVYSAPQEILCLLVSQFFFYQEWFSEVNTSVYRNNFITQHCISIMEYGLVHGWGMVQQQLVCIYFHDHWSSPEAVYVDLLLNSHTSYSKLIIAKVIEEKVSVRWRIFIYESILC